MIVVVGRLESGLARSIAERAVRRGAATQLVATAGEGDRGDAQLAALAEAGVGHAAVLRSGADALDPGDLDLALRYLPDVRVIVLADDTDSLRRVAADAAAWSGAALVVVADAEPEAGGGDQDATGDKDATGDEDATADQDATGAGMSAGDEDATGTIVIAAPRADPDGAFAGVVAELAARLDAGEPADRARAATAAGLGLERVSPGA